MNQLEIETTIRQRILDAIAQGYRIKSGGNATATTVCALAALDPEATTRGEKLISQVAEEVLGVDRDWVFSFFDGFDDWDYSDDRGQTNADAVAIGRKFRAEFITGGNANGSE